MKLNCLFILLPCLLSAGCGVYVHKQQTFYVHRQGGAHPADQTKPKVAVQIVPSTKHFHILFLYESSKWTSPYSIRIWSRSDDPISTPIRVYALKLRADDQVVLNKVFEEPLTLPFKGPIKSGNHTYYEVDYLYELGDRLNFKKGTEVELEVELEHPGFFEKKTIRMQGVGEESKESQSLWSAYMSV